MNFTVLFADEDCVWSAIQKAREQLYSISQVGEIGELFLFPDEQREEEKNMAAKAEDGVVKQEPLQEQGGLVVPNIVFRAPEARASILGDLFPEGSRTALLLFMFMVGHIPSMPI